MKKTLTAIIFVWATHIYAQNVGINSTGATPHASAVLDVDAAPGNDKGLLIPRIALLATNNSLPISAPANSLVVYNTATAGTSPNNVLPGFYYWNGTKWIAFGGTGGTDWSLTGNAGTVAGSNFIGTTDAVDVTVFTNNTEKVRVTSAGNVGIGTNSPNTTFDLAGSASFREASITLANGNNNDIVIGNNSFINITGPAALFTITGITGGSSGRILTIYNSTAQSMILANQSVSSAAINRISTLSGADLITLVGNGSSVQLQYSAAAARWIVISNSQNNSTLSTDIVELVYDQPSGTNGGASVAGAWTTRDINVELTDFNSICVLAVNQFTLPAGTYDVQFNQVFFSEGNVPTQFHSRIKNITAGTTALIALTERAHYPSGTSGNHNCAGSGIIQIASPTIFELQYFAENAWNRGLGYGVSGFTGENERYVYVRIKRIAP
ncbi:MAG: hypothetical protein V4547_08345 [Bacteroidota bacterium]